MSGQYRAAEGSDPSEPASVASPDAAGRARDLASTIGYLLSPEVHVYASSIAANARLAFFPLTLIVLTVWS